MHQRMDFLRIILGDAVLPPRPNPDQFLPHPSERRQAIKRLQCRDDEQPGPQRGEAPDQRRSQRLDLLVNPLARLRHLEPPTDLRLRQDDIALDDAQRLIGEFLAVILVQINVVVRLDFQPPVPQRSRRKRIRAGARHLEIQPRIGLEKALVGGRAIEADLAVGADLGRGDHRVQHIVQLRIEIVDDRSRHHAVERIAAAQQQHADPQRRDADHPPRQRSGAARGHRCGGGHRRRGGGRIAQTVMSSRL